MQRRRFNTRLVASVGAAVLAPLAAGRALAQPAPVEGRHYVRLATPAPVSLPGPDKKVEVIEFFWYECPHCNSFEPLGEAWSRRLSSDVVYRRVPVGFTARHQVAQKAFYALEEMGQLDALHKRIFAAIHVQRQRLMTEQAYVEFVAAQGLDAARFESLMKSFSVATKANRARQLSEAYKIDGTPSLGVGGRYYTSGTLAGSLQAMTAVADHLIMLVRRGG
ncbi:MAG: thiol:disulfide interchange protein DsbA/DsbL [Burkholderiales bacterium]|nr:thiol:disulfide interchange protein DsbA/DsbL [Burkholderiales bacterium]